ncbi:DUF4294 domain-containing protein [Algibacter amylolyticus]|uniref:DUF4294 domain-containing protein n=1 Tax=Algibacter amylolyticus TaxID=1608400 RepID=A0A5M7B5G9_9FLAO|nr:DUF4294 domain-containing protein [Algibacter amylolyticus]KAA5823618.1 DUF4294 domain-containing protein [Algibacter amylolyticus]MBB5267777.1 hypothetical protein [Algibacter amylolyticus]TSJ74106.1 DUF4294 domain-containing protein [Algibacter amylolyticus]
MKYLKYILIFFPVLLFAQIEEIKQDSVSEKYLIIKGDSVPRTSIDLDEVMLLHRLEFNSKKDRIRYLILRRKTIKVYPYAKMAAERLDSMNSRMLTLTKNRDKKRYTKRVQKYIEGEFSEELKKMTRTEGQILVKLIHRQTGVTAFELVKELRNGWRAFWYNTTASMFDISLKREYDPENEKEDYLIEDILQRNFQSGRLEQQKSAIEFDFYDLTNKWVHQKTPE